MSKIYYSLNKEESQLIEELSELTGVDYEIRDSLMPMDSFISLIKDLKYEISKRDERIENYEENYRPVTNKELFSDFEDYRREKGIVD